MLGFGTALPGSQPIPLHRLGVVLGDAGALNLSAEPGQQRGVVGVVGGDKAMA